MPDPHCPQDKDIYLLDDPLAAVDADVAEHLMKRCVLELLGGKTRILCTHRVEFVERADTVVLMDEGTIIRTGRISVPDITITVITICFVCKALFKNSETPDSSSKDGCNEGIDVGFITGGGE